VAAAEAAASDEAAALIAVSAAAEAAAAVALGVAGSRAAVTSRWHTPLAPEAETAGGTLANDRSTRSTAIAPFSAIVTSRKPSLVNSRDTTFWLICESDAKTGTR
jgi:hypothetical protein